MLLSSITPVQGAPSTLPPAVSPAPVETAVDGLPVLVAALLAAALTRLWGARRAPAPPRVTRLGRGAGFRPFGEGLPGAGDGPSVWIAPDAALLAESLASRLAARGPVLLLPRPDARKAAWERFGPGHLPVWIPEEERPTARAALAAAASLVSEGRPPALVVAGPAALEPVVGGRSTAALEELLGASGVPVFVVLEADAAPPAGPWPVVRVNRDADGWTANGARLRVAGGLLEREAG